MKKAVPPKQTISNNEEIYTIVMLISLLYLLAYLLTLSYINYGIFRDELYYLACANRPAFGYVDHPPLSIWILAVWKFIFGDSLFIIRILPAIISTATIFMVGLFTARLGGGKSAVIIATLTFMLSPIFLSMTTTYSMNAFDFFFWILSAYIFLCILQSCDSRLWYMLGIVIGLGLLNKTSMLWLGAGIMIGTLFTPLREVLKTKYPYIAAAIALLIFAPYVIWNMTHDFAHLEFMKNAAISQYNRLSTASFVLDLVLVLNPLSFLIWLPGLVYYFFNKRSRQFRALGYIWLITLAVLFINWHSKAEYFAPAFQILFAGGALMITQWNEKLNRLKYALAVPVVAIGILLSPFARPILPVENLLGYQSALTLKAPNSEGYKTRLPQSFADMFGWEDLAKNVSKVYQSLPEEERKTTVVYCSNYGRAGAVEYYSKKYPLPKVICPHNNYWYWSLDSVESDRLDERLGSANFITVIIIGGGIEDHFKLFERFEVAGVYKTKYAISSENNLPIFIGRGLKVSLEEIMRSNKVFI